MSTPDLTTLLGFRQAQIMRQIWANGPATVRELHTVLATDAPLTYNTVMTVCSRLLEKGLLERRRVTPDDATSRAKQAYVYTARQSETAVLRGQREEPPPFPGIPHQFQNRSDRASIEYLLAYLGMLRDVDGQAVDERMLDSITALLERAESAERAVLIYQAEALRWLRVYPLKPSQIAAARSRCQRQRSTNTLAIKRSAVSADNQLRRPMERAAMICGSARWRAAGKKRGGAIMWRSSAARARGSGRSRTHWRKRHQVCRLSHALFSDVAIECRSRGLGHRQPACGHLSRVVARA